MCGRRLWRFWIKWVPFWALKKRVFQKAIAVTERLTHYALPDWNRIHEHLREQAIMKKRFRLLRRNERSTSSTAWIPPLENGSASAPKMRTRPCSSSTPRMRRCASPLNLQIAKAYLQGTDSGVTTRTWQKVSDLLVATTHGKNRLRWERVPKDAALSQLLPLIVIETPAEAILQALAAGSVSTNVFLRRLHNFSLGMNWLPWHIMW